MTMQVINYQAASAVHDFTASLKNLGFAVIANHPINQTLIDQTYNHWFEFFKSSEKHDFPFDSVKHDGYVSETLSETAKGNTIKDLKEFYHFYPTGRCPNNLKSLTLELYTNLKNLADLLLNWIEKDLPEKVSSQLSMSLSQMIENSQHTLFRIIHYPPLRGDEPSKAIRAAAHEDINLLTLLPAATAEGLQLKTSTNEWLDVPCDPNWIIINAGDMLQECSQGYYRSTTHRVINPQDSAANRSRLSMPLFLHPREDVRLSNQHTAGSYRLERFRELGLVD